MMADPALVFDIEIADRMSQGCGRHADPACLCDVDISHTADIEWSRGSHALIGVSTSSELAQRWADWVYANEIEGPIKPILTERAYNENTLFPDRDGGDLILKQRNWPSLTDLSDDDITTIAAELRAGQSTAHVAREFGVAKRHVQHVANLMGATHRDGHPLPYKSYVLNRYAEGIPSKQIAQEVAAEWGVEAPTSRAISSLANHSGVKRSA